MARKKTQEELIRAQRQRMDSQYINALETEVHVMELLARRAKAAVDLESRRVKRGLKIIHKKEKQSNEQQENNS